MKDYELTALSPILEWALESARSLAIGAHDESGRPLAAHSLRLRGEDADLRVRVREREGEGSMELEHWFTTSAAPPLKIETELLPGAYALEIDLVEILDEDRDEDPPHVRPLDRRDVVIEAGEVRRIHVVD